MNPPTLRDLPESLRIEARFNGPATSGNGGWTAGAVACLWGDGAGAGPVTVALRAPVPLDKPLAVRRAAGGAIHLLNPEGAVVVEAEPAALDLAVPTPPTVEAAEAAGALGRLRNQRRPLDSAYARCFVCGFAREDGLRLSPGPVGDAAGVVATTWVPAADLANPAGQVRTEALWAALDCPAGMAWGEQLPDAPMVTVRMTVAIERPLYPGQRLRVLAWPLARDGRKLHAGSALVDDAGTVCARSQQLWLMPKDAQDARGAQPPSLVSP